MSAVLRIIRIWAGIFWPLTVALALGLSQLPHYIPVIVLKLYQHDFMKNAPTKQQILQACLLKAENLLERSFVNSL